MQTLEIKLDTRGSDEATSFAELWRIRPSMTFINSSIEMSKTEEPFPCLEDILGGEESDT